MTTSQQAKLKYLSRRGMLELDLLLDRFLKYTLPHLTVVQYKQLEHLLSHADPDLLNWLMGYSVPKDKEIAHVVAWVRSYLT